MSFVPSTNLQELKTYHIYNGGSFSPPTLAHQEICINSIKYLMEYIIKNSYDIDTIILHIVPCSDLYDKPSVSSDCVTFNDRFNMLKTMAHNITTKIGGLQTVSINGITKTFDIKINVNDFENKLSHTIDSNGKKIGYIGTYKYLAKWSIDKISSNIFLLFGLDNAISLITGGTNRWNNSIHLVSKFKFLIYPRSGVSINYSFMSSLFDENINDCVTNLREDINIEKNPINFISDITFDLDDVKIDIDIFKSNPEKFMKEHFIEVKTDIQSDIDIITLAETSSSGVRKVLYNYGPEFKLKQSVIDENLKMIDPCILPIVKTLYSNGRICEGETKFQEIKSSMPADWIELN